MINPDPQKAMCQSEIWDKVVPKGTPIAMDKDKPDITIPITVFNRLPLKYAPIVAQILGNVSAAPKPAIALKT